MLGFIRSGVAPINLLAYKELLRAKGIEVFAIAEDKKEKSEYDPSIEVYCLEEWYEKHWYEIDVGELSKYQEKYQDYSLWEIFYTDRYIRYKYAYRDAEKILLGLIKYWEDLIQSSHATYIVSDCIIGADNFIGMVVGRKVGVPYISIQTSRLEKYRSYISLGEGYRSVEYDKLIEEKYVASDEEIKNTEKFIQAYIEKRQQPFYISSKANESKQIGKLTIFYLLRLKNISYLWDKRFKNKYNIHDYKGQKMAITPLQEAMRRIFIQKYFHNPDYNEDYILFPLHFQPEASTCVYARKYENQLFFIEQLSKSIPAGKVLYVKEHSVRQGHKPLSFYKEVEKLSNVKLISPDVNAHEIMKHASFLVCLTSTMGFEALMHGKTVFICGNSFYEDFSGVVKIKDVFMEKEKFMHPPVQSRELYLYQMACFIKTTRICSFMEEQISDETPEECKRIQKKTIDELVHFIQTYENW